MNDALIRISSLMRGINIRYSVSTVCGVLQRLSRTCCKIGDPSVHNLEIDDLPARISKHIPAHMQYACRHWASHLLSGSIPDTTVIFFEHFARVSY